MKKDKEEITAYLPTVGGIVDFVASLKSTQYNFSQSVVGYHKR